MAEHIDDEIERQVAALCAQLPPGVAEWLARPLTSGGAAVEVKPLNRNAAPVSVYTQIGNSTVTVCLGRSTIIELTPDRRWPIHDQIHQICEEVFAGRFSEELWLSEGEVRKCHGHIAINGMARTFRYYAAARLLSKSEQHIVIDYAPYL